MYIDVRKFNYKAFGYPDAEERVERDKAFAKKAYTDWFERNIDRIIERQWEIDDIGVVERTGDFVKLLREAEFTYSIGAYTSTLALTGVCAEDLCKFLMNVAGHKDKSRKQEDRIDKLHELGILDDAVKARLHTIRGLRNSCLHFDQAFKAKDASSVRGEALRALNALKHTYASLVGALDYKTVDSTKFGELLKTIVEQATVDGAPTGVTGHDDMQVRLRNLFAAAFGMDLSLDDPGQVMERMAIFVVDEVDFDSMPPELTLIDPNVGLPVIVDLDAKDVEDLKRLEVEAGDLLAVSIRSVPDGLGMTSAWRLASEVQKLT